jgi:hypothetical protein
MIYQVIGFFRRLCCNHAIIDIKHGQDHAILTFPDPQ